MTRDEEDDTMRRNKSFSTREQAGVILGYHPDQGYICPVRKERHSRVAGNRDGIVDYLFNNVFWMLIGMVWYRLFLFRCLEHQTLVLSRAVLWGLVLTGTGLGTLLNIRHHRNIISVCFNLLIGYGIYTVLAYMPVRPDLISTVLLYLTSAVSAFLTWQVVRRVMAGQSVLPEGRWMAMVMQRMLGFGFAVIIAVTGSARAFNSALIKAAVPPASDQNIENQTIQNNMGILTALADGRWEQYTAREKLNVLQTVANIEQRSLGLPHELNVGAEDMSRDKAGTYRDKTHEIRISTASLLYDSPWELVNTVCHEAYHAYQHRLIDLLIETRQENRGLMMFREIREYAEEFQNYTGTDGDFNTYYYQQCESDARDFAEDSEREYFIRIKDYLHPDNEQDNASAEPPVGREIMT